MFVGGGNIVPNVDRKISLRMETKSADTSPSRHTPESGSVVSRQRRQKDDIVLRKSPKIK